MYIYKGVRRALHEALLPITDSFSEMPTQTVWTTPHGTVNWWPGSGTVTCRPTKESDLTLQKYVEDVLKRLAAAESEGPEYWVVESNNNMDFSQQCTDMLKKGWTLHGVMRSNSVNGSIKLLQAFLKGTNV